MRDWEISTSCYPYSNDLTLDTGSQTFCQQDPCEACGSELAAFDPDGETDSDGTVRDLTSHRCARCEGPTEARWSDNNTREQLMAAIAKTLFRDGV